MGALLNLARGGDSAWTPISETPKLTPAGSEAAELRRLVRQCGELYNFTEEEHREALEIALADHEGALTCFRAMAAEMGVLEH